MMFSKIEILEKTDKNGGKTKFLVIFFFLTTRSNQN